MRSRRKANKTRMRQMSILLKHCVISFRLWLTTSALVSSLASTNYVTFVLCRPLYA